MHMGCQGVKGYVEYVHITKDVLRGKGNNSGPCYPFSIESYDKTNNGVKS